MKIRVGSRESRLAIIQSQIMIDTVKRYHPEIEFELITMKTTGDKILDKSLDKIGGKGLFVKELDRALENNEVDLTVHSFKDMPMEVNERLPIVAVSAREKPNDVLILPVGASELDLTKPIGSSSLRRSIQIKSLYPGCIIKPIRGNVISRLEHLDNGEFSALILAEAGINRLSLQHRISRIFSVEECIPAACQGILAVQARTGFETSFMLDFNDTNSWLASVAERSFVKTLNGGCSSPIAAYAVVDVDKITLTGFYVVEGSEIIHKKTLSDSIINAKKLGERLARILKGQVNE